MPSAEKFANSRPIEIMKAICDVTLRLLLFPAAALAIGCALGVLTQI